MRLVATVAGVVTAGGAGVTPSEVAALVTLTPAGSRTPPVAAYARTALIADVVTAADGGRARAIDDTRVMLVPPPPPTCRRRCEMAETAASCIDLETNHDAEAEEADAASEVVNGETDRKVLGARASTTVAIPSPRACH